MTSDPHDTRKSEIEAQMISDAEDRAAEKEALQRAAKAAHEWLRYPSVSWENASGAIKANRRALVKAVLKAAKWKGEYPLATRNKLC